MTTSADPVGSLATSSSWQEVPLVEKGELYDEGDIVKISNWQADQMLCYGRLNFDASATKRGSVV